MSNTIDRSKLQDTLSLIKHDEIGFFTDGKFVDLSSTLQLESTTRREINQI